MGKVGDHHVGFLGPALGRHTAVARVDADGHVTRKRLGGFTDQIGVFHGDGAKDHTLQPLGQPHFDRGHVADAAAQLGGHLGRAQDILNRLGVHRLAREGPVQVHKVQPLTPRIHKRLRLRGGVVVEHGRLIHLALVQADTLAILQIDSGIEDHVAVSFGFWRCYARAGAECNGPHVRLARLGNIGSR